VAFGPRPGPNGFSWDNGSRLYYANLTANFGATRSDQTFKGFEAIAVSRTDDVQSAAAGHNNAWRAPVVISKQSSTTFSDKEQIWADNAASSPHFGTVYTCWAAFTGQEKGNAAPAPLQVAVSHDGGDTWTQHQVSAAANNSQRNPEDGCTIRTDSAGNAYVFGVGTVSSQGKQAFELMSVSRDGGGNWSTFSPVAGPVSQPGLLDPVQGRPVIDGVAGARSDLAPAPSVDIANGAPTGSDATDRMVLSYVQRNHRRAPRVLHRVKQQRHRLGHTTTHRNSRRSGLVHRPRHIAQRHRRVRRVQRVHHAVSTEHDRSTQSGRSGTPRRQPHRSHGHDGNVH
jgi:hypothetical protein